jgi:hypothetical protein
VVKEVRIAKKSFSIVFGHFSSWMIAIIPFIVHEVNIWDHECEGHHGG